MTQQEYFHNHAHAAWMASYRKNPNHAIKDANMNLKGFRASMGDFLKRNSVDTAFRLAVARSLKIMNRLEVISR